MKTLIATMLAVAAGSAMACPGEKSAAATPGAVASKDSTLAKADRNRASAKPLLVAKATQATTSAR